MREIKFRAWDKDNKEMLYELDNKGYHEDLMKPFDNLDTKSYYEIMQFTGLFDKNGKEIYEGDIIEQIFYGDEISKIILVVEDIRNLESIRCGSSKENKIIGNIYENPEFVETKGSEGK